MQLNKIKAFYGYYVYLLKQCMGIRYKCINWRLSFWNDKSYRTFFFGPVRRWEDCWLQRFGRQCGCVLARRSCAPWSAPGSAWPGPRLQCTCKVHRSSSSLVKDCWDLQPVFLQSMPWDQHYKPFWSYLNDCSVNCCKIFIYDFRQIFHNRANVWGKKYNTENAHHRGEYHCTADLLFEWFRFDQTSKTGVHSTIAKHLKPKKINRMPVVQWYFPLS